MTNSKHSYRRRPFAPGFMIVFTTALLLAIGLAPASQADTDAPNNALIVLGDSISAGYGIDVEKGWVRLLADKISQAGFDTSVVNASISGNTTADGLTRLPQLLATHQPAIVVVELGGNDGLRGHPLKKMRDNLQRIVNLSESAGARVLLLGIEIPPNYGQRYTDEFRASFAQIAGTNDLAFVPFILRDIALNSDLMQKDGIHPTQAAQRQLVDIVWPSLQPMLEATASQN
ncbi:arylesterase [Halioxenophilus aromaticivorans]